MAGQVVLTRYNNRTYVVSEVDFEKTPASVFAHRQGSMSFMQYYSQQWHLQIQDSGQPLLLCKMPWRPEPVYLVPELCYQTGLSPDMLADFNTMKALANITKKEPAERLRACQ